MQVVEAPDWADGLATSLRAGLETVETMSPIAVLIHLVDLPDVGSRVVRRVLDDAVADRTDRRHRAQHYLRRHGLHGVECGDPASGLDIDSPP